MSRRRQATVLPIKCMGFGTVAAGAQPLDGLARQGGHSHDVAHTQQTGLAGDPAPPSLGGQVSALLRLAHQAAAFGWCRGRSASHCSTSARDQRLALAVRWSGAGNWPARTSSQIVVPHSPVTAVTTDSRKTWTDLRSASAPASGSLVFFLIAISLLHNVQNKHPLSGSRLSHAGCNDSDVAV